MYVMYVLFCNVMFCFGVVCFVLLCCVLYVMDVMNVMYVMM